MRNLERVSSIAVLRRAIRGATIVGVYGTWVLVGLITDRDGTGRRATQTLYRLGPTYVKLAQLLGSRHDLLPPVWCQRLSSLTDQVPPPPWSSIAATLADAYGPHSPLASIDATPIGSGSIATVHRATLPDGRVVAVKVRRPEVERSLLVDLTMVARFTRLSRWVPGLRDVPVVAIVDQMCAAVLRQADLSAERDNLARIRDNLRTKPFVRVPAVLDAYSTEAVLTMELMSGLRRLGTPPEGRPGDRQMRRTSVTQLLNVVYEMLFVDGLVHCDLHYGNVYSAGANDLVILDAGFVVALPERVRELFARFFVGMAVGDGQRCAQIVLDSAALIPPNCDRSGFVAAMSVLVSDASGSTAGRFSLAAFATRLFDLQRRYGIYAAAEFAFPLLALLVIEGIVNEIDADVDFQAIAVPIVARALGMPAFSSPAAP